MKAFALLLVLSGCGVGSTVGGAVGGAVGSVAGGAVDLVTRDASDEIWNKEHLR